VSHGRWTAGPWLVAWGIVIGIAGSVIAFVGFAALGGDSDADGGDGSPDLTTTTIPQATTGFVATTTTGTPAPTTSLSTAVPPSTTMSPTDARAPQGAVVDEHLTSCPPSTVRVTDAEQLQAALDAAVPGDSIEIADGVFTGAFVASRSGTEAAPVFLCGRAAAVLDGGGIREGYVLHLDGVQHWRVVGFTVQNGQKGVMADATSHSVIQGLTVQDIGDEAIHLRSASSYNSVLGNTIRRTGLRRDKFGEGVYVGSATSNWSKYSGGAADRSDHNVVQGNSISQTGSESIDIKEGTTGGRVIGNILDGTGMTGADSLIDIKGNDWIIEDNLGAHAPNEALQTHRILDGWGTGNTFRSNTVDVDGDGRHIYIHDPDVTDNVVMCDNRTGSGVELRSNVDCVA
jgi:hypothetical protein